MSKRGRSWLCLIVVPMLLSSAQAADAQVVLTGDWLKAEGALPIIGESELGDFTALPIRPESLPGGDSWTEARWSQIERGCSPYGAAGSYRGPALIRISELRDPATQKLLGIQTFIATFAQARTIWLDDRQRPSKYAAHTWQGFSKGTWNNNILTVVTTHLKQFWHRRNGVIASDDVVLTEQFIRHGSYLTWVMMADDPKYLTEPLVYSETFRLGLDVQPDAYQSHLDCQADEEIAGRPDGYVPHWLPGTAPATEVTKDYGIPFEATRGGAATMYPEYQETLKGLLKSQRSSGAATR